MRPGEAKTATAKEWTEAALRGAWTERQARRLAKEDPEVLALALLATPNSIAELQGRSHEQRPSPSTPSGMVPIDTKPNIPKRGKKPGARNGHPGARRRRPERIDRRQTHRLKRCPCCGGPLQRGERKHTRVMEDIPEDIQPVATGHTIWGDDCPNGKKHVERVVPDAWPRAEIGHHVISLTSWLQDPLGVTIDQIIDLLWDPLPTELTAGG